MSPSNGRRTVRGAQSGGAAPLIVRYRRIVLAAAVAALLVKLVIAATTYGTNDISHWHDFVLGVRATGPIGVYGLDFTPVNGYNASFYNHPPLMGDVLAVISWIDTVGIPWKFTIRALASAADVGTALVVFELLRSRRPAATAMWSGVLVALSPVLLAVSGFHGNTDPLFTLLALLSVHLLADRRAPVIGGVVAVLALGVKIVPVVIVPCLLAYAWRAGRPVFWRFCAGAAAAFVVTWVPALVLQPARVISHVWGYAGSELSQWGFSQWAHWLGDPGWLSWYAGPGRLLIVAVCALAPAVAVWRRPELLPVGVAVALAGFLALSPAFGVQYLVWPMAGLYLVDLGLATLYSVLAGGLLIRVYLGWTYRPGATPWDVARAAPLTPGEVVAGVVVWLALCAGVARGVRILLGGEPPGGGAGRTSGGVHARRPKGRRDRRSGITT